MKIPYTLHLHRFTKMTVGTAFVLTALSCATVQADVLYRETFGTTNTTAGGQNSASQYDWDINIGSTGTDKSTSTDTTASINRTANASNPGTSDPVGQVNAGATIGPAPAAYGAGIAFSTVAAGNALFWTPEYATTSGTGSGINPSLYSSLSISWFQGDTGTDASFRAAVEIGGLWYVSQQTFANTVTSANAAAFATSAQLMTFNFTTAASSWDLLNFDGTYSMATHTGTSGTVLTLGAQPGSALSGNIDAFGLFSDVPGTVGNRRVDSFEIDGTPTAVPEPASVALLGLGGLGALLLKRRKA